MKYRFVAISIIFFVTACTSTKVSFKPAEDYLPNAQLNQYYSGVILANFNSNGELLPFSKRNSSVKITPVDSGLYSEPDFENCSNADKSNKCGYHDYILIKGMPRKRGEVQVEVTVRTPPNMYTKAGYFNKYYSIKIE
ncbi:hypothetical protein ACL2XO_13265 [Sodalis sp. RH15]|jgi:hypothetical protein|uniref:hypothetical protein n=1 Tax=Sodalis sp. RH15 TaxID=3394330 RepID=UPI0039B3B1D3